VGEFMDFNEIVGHDMIIDYLKKAIENGKVSHSYLFEGEESIGKRMVALAFAKALLCKEIGNEPCNRCISCTKFDNANHPDFQLIEPERGLISMKTLDKLLRTVNIAPLESKRKIILIDDSHCMGLGGQNILLKTLEEPPAYINIILLSSNSNMLVPTILSRCQIIKFQPVESSRIIALLRKEYKKTWEEANFIAHFTKGSVGRSIEISRSTEFEVKRKKVIELIDDVVNGGKGNIFTARDFLLDNKDSIEEILDIILYWFRDLAIYKKVGSTELIINMDSISLLSNQSYLSMDRINDIIERIEEARDNILEHVNYQLAIETMLLCMQEV